VVPLLATPANLRHLWKGQTPLHMALAPEQGQERVVSMAGVLLAAGAPPGLPNVHGVTPLQLAAKTGCGPVVSLLVAAGASIRCRAADGDTVLHTAVGSNQLDVVKRLLAAGADPGAASASGHNSLHAAAAAGHCRILQALLAAVAAGQGTAGLGAEVLGMTALHLAVEHQHWECVEVLVAAGADPHQLYGAGAGQLHRASALHRAVQLGGEAVVPLLATPTSLRYLWKGQTPLHMALAPEQDLQLQVTMVHALLAAGASPGQPNQHGVTPLQLAARSSRVTTMGLAADIVRSECVLYQQRQQTQQLRTKERALNALLARVADAVCDLLGGTYLPACMSCITAVMEVLGVEAGSALVSQLLEGEFAMHIDSGAEVGMQLANMLYRSWLAVVQPHTHKQGQVISRLQALVLQPQQQRLQEQQFGAHHQEPLRATSAAAGKQAGQAPGAAAQLHAKGVAAVHAGQWHALMQCLEQLMAVHPSHEGDDAAALLEVAVGMCSHSWPQLARLSDVLLAAWWEAQHATAARVSPEVVEAVVAVVQAWQQLQGQSAPMGANSRRRLG
jgi:ankyrin repeat protein